MLLSALIAMGFNSYANASSLQAQILSFEEVSLPSWITSNNSQLSQTRAIHGNQSLLWQWQQDETLTINHTFYRLTNSEATDAYGRSATQVFSFWLYNPVAIEDTMTIVLSDASDLEPANLNINLNFSGWRAIGVSLNSDFPQTVTENLAKLTFHAPSSSKITSGSFYIDRVMISVDDSRYQWSDYQVTTRYTMPEIDFGLPAYLPLPTQTELDDAETLKQTLITEYTYGKKSLADLKTRFNALGIFKDHLANISGRHIITGYQKVIYQPKHLLPADKVGFDNYTMLSDYTELMLDISQAYHQPTFIADRQQLTDMYLLMTEHLLDQGFAAGSGLVTTHHWGYGARWWYISALMMADDG